MKNTTPAPTGKRLLRPLFLLALSAFFLYLLSRLGVLNLGLFQNAFREGGRVSLAIVGLLGVMSLLGVLKFYSVLKLFSLAPKLPDVLSANLISQAVGQWAPGSMAVTEIIRFGLIAGIGVDQRKPDLKNTAPELRGLLGLSILMDRLIGLGVMFFVSGSAALYLLIQRNTVVRLPAVLGGLAAAALGLGALFLFAPLITRSAAFRKRFLLRSAAQESPMNKTPRPRGHKALKSRFSAAWRFFVRALTGASARPGRLLIPWGLSLGIAILNPLTLYLSALAVGRRLPFSVILVAVPFTILAILLPLGFAGYGGPQVIAAGAFGLFHVDLETVVAACLVQNTIVVAATTLFGILSAGLVLKRLRAILEKR